MKSAPSEMAFSHNAVFVRRSFDCKDLQGFYNGRIRSDGMADQGFYGNLGRGSKSMIRLAYVVLPLIAIAAATPTHGQSPDFAENNAAQWGTFAPVDQAASSAANSTTLVKDGAASILFTTGSGFDTGVKYPAAGNLNFNASAYNYLTFWEYPNNNTPIGWQGNQPIVVIRTGQGTITLTPNSQLTPNHAWRLFKVPLAGGDGWNRTTTGSPNLADMDQIEIHHDTWDSGFDITFDGVRFMTLNPNALPPAGPAPPPGVDPSAIDVKVLLYIYNPVMTNFGGQRMNQVYGWGDSVTLTNQIISDFQESSHGKVRFHVIQTIDDTTFPYLESGFQYTAASYHQAWTSNNLMPGTFDYVRFGTDHGLSARVDSGEIDEVWVYSFPGSGMWESAMAGSGAYWINGGAYPAAGGQRAFVIMGWNFERGVGEAIHSWGHRSESIMVHAYGSWPHDRSNTWGRFALLNSDIPGQGGIGNVHFPVNGTSDYDYANPNFVQSNADAWLNYPNLNDNTRLINFHEWSPAGNDPQREYLNWWYAHMPHVGGRAPDYYLANWWRYLIDVDQFKTGSNGNLYLTLGLPSVRIDVPATGAVVSGIVHIVASAEVDGALGRVDLYVDGAYSGTDSLAPYTFDWNTLGLISGSHTLVAKTYELQNGTEGISTAVVVNVNHCAPGIGVRKGDENLDGYVDGLDIALFVHAMVSPPPTGSAQFCATDMNGDGQLSTITDIPVFIGCLVSGPCP
jgi:hypothetical protein